MSDFNNASESAWTIIAIVITVIVSTLLVFAYYGFKQIVMLPAMDKYCEEKK
jgi:putative effector of murein hydrolase LrgA (UPF0299 family)